MDEAATMFKQQKEVRELHLMDGLPPGLVEADLYRDHKKRVWVHLTGHEIEYSWGYACDGMPCQMGAKAREEIGPAIWTLIELQWSIGSSAGVDGDWAWMIWGDGRVYSVKEMVARVAKKAELNEFTVRKHLNRLRQYGWVKFVPCPEVSWIKKGGLWFLRR